MKYYIAAALIMALGCGAELTQKNEARADLVIVYPQMDRCFDLFETGKIGRATFITCLEETSSHEITVNGEVVVTAEGEEIGNLEDLIKVP